AAARSSAVAGAPAVPGSVVVATVIVATVVVTVVARRRGSRHGRRADEALVGGAEVLDGHALDGHVHVFLPRGRGDTGAVHRHVGDAVDGDRHGRVVLVRVVHRPDP